MTNAYLLCSYYGSNEARHFDRRSLHKPDGNRQRMAADAEARVEGRCCRAITAVDNVGDAPPVGIERVGAHPRLAVSAAQEDDTVSNGVGVYAFAKTVPYMDDQCEVDKTFYNFCRKHRGLKGETPAMRQGITDHVWSVAEVLGYRSAAQERIPNVTRPLPITVTVLSPGRMTLLH